MAPDDLSSLDVSVLDALVRIETEQKSIRALADKAAARRAREAEIYARVTKDYDARISALADQAEPIRQRLRDDLHKLEEMLRASHESLDGARVQLQECEFRHEIGEYSVEEFQRCQQTANKAIKEKEKAVENVKALQQRYLDLLPAMPASAAAAPPPPVESRPSPAPPAPAAPNMGAAAKSGAVAAATPAGKQSVPGVAAAAAAAGDNRTVFLRPPSAQEFDVPAGGAAPADTAAEFRTITVGSAMLVEDREGLPGTAHRLGDTTTIGRTPDNQIMVPLKEVSRKHAQIVSSDGGYLLKDLGSPNGTFVNGQRIQEHKLKDGDRIVLGPAAFTFKAS